MPIKYNKEHWRAFNRAWFSKHLTLLLWLLNAPIISWWFRRVIKINNKRKIIEIFPHAYTVLENNLGELTTVFCTHEKYAKRIYTIFKPLWWSLHFWDWLIADRLLPKLSTGFITLTTFPDPASGATTVDGYAFRDVISETFAALHAGAGTGFDVTDGNLAAELDASATLNEFNILYRSILTFDTSVINSGAISSATLSLNGTTKGIGLGSPDLHIAGATPAVNNILQASDYNQCQITSFGSITNIAFTVGIYNDILLNANGVANINKTGISKFSTQLSWDLSNNFTGAWGANLTAFFYFKSADTAGTAQDPQLAITYADSTRKWILSR